MTTKHIIYIPGKNPETEAAQQRELLWKTLIEGVRRADSIVANTLQTHLTQLHLISWNHLFYHTYIDISHRHLLLDVKKRSNKQPSTRI